MTELELDAERYGDSEPEDAWQVTDPVVVLLDNLARRLGRWFGITTILEGDETVRAELVRRWELLNVLTADLERRRADLEPELVHRLELVRADLETLRRRLEAVADG